MTCILKVKENKNKELYIQFPKKLLKKLNWTTGDKLNWTKNKDGSYTIEKEKP